METSEIDFCNKTAYNIKNLRYKYTILQNLQKQYKIDLSDTYTKFNNKFISKFSKFDYLISLLTSGTPYLLYLTKINNENYTLFIDKKILAGHKLPKIIIVNYRFHDSLYSNTIFEGELLKNQKNNWCFIINDILVYKAKTLKLNLVSKIKLLYDILKTSYIKDNNIEICPIYIKQFFHPKDFKNLYTHLINKIKYKSKGIIFNQLNYNNKVVFYFNNTNINNNTKFNLLKNNNSYLNSVDEENKLLKEINKNNCNLSLKEEEDILLDLLDNVEESDSVVNDKSFVFEIKFGDKPNIYYLYCNKNNKKYRHSIARIDTLECAAMLNTNFKSHHNNIFVICKYSIKYNKWIPIEISNNKFRDDFFTIDDYIKTFN
uniref:mRNA capping enzyme adenylation domain-containing protein n=1 Tax=viral metagenome TaxID=1070528 RepID=A0A6C0IXF4_9ZZZZ